VPTPERVDWIAFMAVFAERHGQFYVIKPIIKQSLTMRAHAPDIPARRKIRDCAFIQGLVDAGMPHFSRL